MWLYNLYTKLTESNATDWAIYGINGIEHFLVIKMEEHGNNQTTQTPDVQTQTCQSSPRQEQKNKTDGKLIMCHLQKIC